MALTKVTSGMVNPDPTNASNLSSGSVPLAQLGNAPATDVTGLEDDIALLGFRVASNGSFAKYNLVDQTVDDFQDSSGIDASSSTNEVRYLDVNYVAGGTTSNPTGGTVTTVGTNTVHSFLTTADFVASVAGTVDALVVAGGGSGGGAHYDGGRGGGGGAGGVRVMSDFAVTAATHAATVGAFTNGTGAGVQGNDSTFMTITANGGGAGGFGSNNAGGGGSQNGGDGGSGGGGGSGSQPTSARSGGAGNDGSFDPVEGYAGGSVGATTDSNRGGGGGGGAGQVGESSLNTPNSLADGGDGIQNDYRTGSDVYYGGGGGGGGALANTSGGQGGGGVGYAHANHGGDATANTGGGGGAGAGTVQHSNGGDGAAGIIVLRYDTASAFTSPANLTLVSATTAAEAAPTKGDIVLTYTNGAGTTTLDTDLTAEISADGGSTWTALALGSEGSTGSHNIATSHDVTISSTITAPYNMAYRIKTLNQSGSKTTRIQAVSLGWS